MGIKYFTDNDCKFQLREKLKISRWLREVANAEGQTIDDLTYIFVTDSKMLEINKQYLQHDYFTDIITFNYNNKNSISGEMYISVDTVKINAVRFKADFSTEMRRVILHGVLHLCGYNDHISSAQQTMRQKEDQYLALYDQLT